MGERLADVAEYPVVHAVGVVTADDDQLRVELLGLVEDEVSQAVWAMTADVGRSCDPGSDQLVGDLLSESKRFWNRLFLDGRRRGDDALSHVHHQDLRAECLGQPCDNRYNLFGVLRAAHRDEDLGKHQVALHLCGWGMERLFSPHMAGRVQHYRAELKKRRGDWETYLKANSGLPGPRANLELVEAVGEEADADLLWRLSASSDEFLALCGTAGLGRLVRSDETVLPWLKELAEDPRWRVREGVAIALQRFGRSDMARLTTEMEAWSKAGPLVQRAAAAALCEPPLLKKPDEVKRVVGILDHITRSMAATRERKHESFRVLRQAMGYCWSVAAAANPEAARPLLEKWLRSSDPDIAWVMKSNLGKARMGVMGKSWLAASKAALSRRPKPTS